MKQQCKHAQEISAERKLHNTTPHLASLWRMQQTILPDSFCEAFGSALPQNIWKKVCEIMCGQVRCQYVCSKMLLY